MKERGMGQVDCGSGGELQAVHGIEASDQAVTGVGLTDCLQ